MHTCEGFAWLLAAFGGWWFYAATVYRLRAALDRMPGRGPRGFAGTLWRMERRNDGDRATRWQRLAVLIALVGLAVALTLRHFG
jgi:hypothetical protein